MQAKEFFMEELNQFETESVRQAVENMLEEIPEYFWTIPASSTGKYHPDYTLGYGGLSRHVKAACKFLNYMLGLEYVQQKTTTTMREAMRVAILFHDSFKRGVEYAERTQFDHPLIAGDFLLTHRQNEDFVSNVLLLASKIVKCHMGEWNRSSYSDVVLPKPETFQEFLVHLSDYMASRKDVQVLLPES